MDEKLRFVSKKLGERQETNNYYGFATDSGFKDISALNYLIKVKTGMTLMNYHKNLQKKKKRKR